MNDDLFSHQEQDADVAVTEKKPPSSMIFLEPPNPATPEPPKSPTRRPQAPKAR